MAKERQREEMSESEERRARIRKQAEELNSEYARAEQERMLESSKKNFGKRKDQLATRAADMIQKYGKDYFMSQTLLTFLDVAIQMEDTIDMLTDVSTAVSCITDAMQCMDNILQINAASLESTQNVNHGFFARRKAKKRMQKTINNNLGRIKEIMFMMEGSQQLAFSITEGLQKANKKTQKRLAKNAASRTKYQVKRNGGSLPPTNAELMVDKILSERSGGTGSGGGTGNNGGTSIGGAQFGGGTGAPANVGGSGTDDISDIL
ncbi:MAG: hypothetical protein J1F69_04715 [Clostridiales bacterium]|nr:hypothetical protein [Clostridiales bacterium]